MPVGGVVQNNHASYLFDEAFYHGGIDLDFESHLTECPHDEHDECWVSNGAETWLVGFVSCEPEEAWFAQQSQYYQFAYKPDPEAEFSAIMGEIYTQIVQSKYVIKCAWCSPCFPGQGDCETPGDVEAYCLPPDMFDEEFDRDFPIKKITEYKE